MREFIAEYWPLIFTLAVAALVTAIGFQQINRDRRAREFEAQIKAQRTKAAQNGSPMQIVTAPASALARDPRRTIRRPILEDGDQDERPLAPRRVQRKPLNPGQTGSFGTESGDLGKQDTMVLPDELDMITGLRRERDRMEHANEGLNAKIVKVTTERDEALKRLASIDLEPMTEALVRHGVPMSGPRLGEAIDLDPDSSEFASLVALGKRWGLVRSTNPTRTADRRYYVPSAVVVTGEKTPAPLEWPDSDAMAQGLSAWAAE